MAEPPANRTKTLRGYRKIAEFLDTKPGYVKWLIENQELPTFRVGGRVCADELAILNWARLRDESQRR